MASNINPNIINGSYPVAGQDNNSQGLRDNFTNIKTNFQYSANEINDLQSKVLLKSALSGGTLDNNLNGALLQGARIQNFSATRQALGSVSGAVTINYAAGHYQTLSTAGSVSLVFANWPTAGSYGQVRIQITVNSTDHQLVLPEAVSLNLSSVSGIQPGTPGSINTIRFLAVGVYEYEFSTSNNGTTVTIFDLNGGSSTVAPTESVIALLEYFDGNNTNAAQPVLGNTNNNVELMSSTAYLFDAQYMIERDMGDELHSIATAFAFTGTVPMFNGIRYTATTSLGSLVNSNIARALITTLDASTVYGPTTDRGYLIITINGMIQTQDAGVLTPQFKYSEAPGGAPYVHPGSYFRIKPIGPAAAPPP